MYIYSYIYIAPYTTLHVVCCSVTLCHRIYFATVYQSSPTPTRSKCVLGIKVWVVWGGGPGKTGSPQETPH